MALILMGLTSFFVKRKTCKLYICISSGQVGKVGKVNRFYLIDNSVNT